MSNSPNILIVKYRALGDSVMGLSTISYLRSIYPNSKIYYGIRSWTKSLYDEVETDADEIIPLSFESFKDYQKSYKKIKSLNIDHIHELHLSGRSQKFFKLFSLINKAKYTFHNHHLKSGGPVIDQGEIKSLIQRDLDGAYTFLGKEFGNIPSYLEFPPQVKVKTAKKERIIFGVVATRQTKMWSLSNFISLANLIKEKFAQYEIIVPLSPSNTDKEIKSELARLDQNDNLKFVFEDLKDLPALIGAAHLYIGNDTGLKHIAIACGVKSYTFFGPEPPREWHPYDKNEHPYFFIDPLDCRYENAHYCGLATCESMICLKNITPHDVFAKIIKDLDKEE